MADADNDGCRTAFTLMESPKRVRVTPVNQPDKGRRTFLKPDISARVIFFVAAIATLALLETFHHTRDRPQLATTKPRVNTSVVTATAPPETSHESQDEISDKAWHELLKVFRTAVTSVQNPTRMGWIPLVISDSKMWLAPSHLEIVSKHARFPIFRDMMQHALLLNESNPILNNSTGEVIRSFPMVMSLHDIARCGKSHFPRFSWCTVADPRQCKTFAVPSYNLYKDAPQTTVDYQEFHDKLERVYPWSSKKPLAVWRGGTTGRLRNGWAAIPRAQLVNVSIHHPELLDGAFVNSHQLKNMFPKEEVKLRNNSRFENRMLFYDFQRYRAVMDIDGNAWSDRFGNLLRMNSVVVKVHPNNENYFYRELVPWVHYIPVAANMSDILEALNFAVSNATEAEVRTIVHAANEWTRIHLTKEHLAFDVFGLLNSYAKLIGNNTTRWSQWTKLLKLYQRSLSLVES